MFGIKSLHCFHNCERKYQHVNDLHLIFAQMSVTMNVIIDSINVFYGTINGQLAPCTQILFNGIDVADVLHIYIQNH